MCGCGRRQERAGADPGRNCLSACLAACGLIAYHSCHQSDVAMVMYHCLLAITPSGDREYLGTYKPAGL